MLNSSQAVFKRFMQRSYFRQTEEELSDEVRKLLLNFFVSILSNTFPLQLYGVLWSVVLTAWVVGRLIANLLIGWVADGLGRLWHHFRPE